MKLIEKAGGTYVRMILGSVAIAACSSASDETGPLGKVDGTGSPGKVEVQLTVSQTRVTDPGNLTFEATVSGTVQRVDLYQRQIGSESAVQVVASDDAAPFTFSRPIVSPDSNGTFEYTARAYKGSSEVGVSNPLTVVIDIPDTRPLEAFFAVSHQRITTPGSITFSVGANKVVTRLEVYSGDSKVTSLDAPTLPYVISVPVTAADNGTKAYVAKAYDDNGHVVASDPMSVVIDIRWDLIRTTDVRTNRESHIATDGTSAIYIAATVNPPDIGGGVYSDAFIEKYDAAGNLVWSRAFGGPDGETVGSVGVAPNGNVFIAGSISRPNFVEDCFLAVFDDNGLVRSQGITGLLVEHAAGCMATADANGNYYVVGNSGADTTGGDFFVTKYDLDGNQLWLHKLRSVAFPSSQFPNDILTDIVVDASGVYIGGYTGRSFDGQPNRGPRDVFLLKFDSDGNKLWARQYGSSALYTFSTHLTVDPAGGVYVAGQTDDAVQRGVHTDALILSYAADGTPRWVHSLDGGGTDAGNQVVVTQHGIYLVGYFSHSQNPTAGMEPLQKGANAFLARFTPGGEVVDIRLLSAGPDTWADAAIAATNGDIYVDAAVQIDAVHRVLIPVLARHHDPAP